MRGHAGMVSESYCYLLAMFGPTIKNHKRGDKREFENTKYSVTDHKISDNDIGLACKKTDMKMNDFCHF